MNDYEALSDKSLEQIMEAAATYISSFELFSIAHDEFFSRHPDWMA